MVDDTFSCIKEVTRTVHIALPSLYISNEIAGVSEILESWKRQYNQQLQGVVVSYKNVTLASNSGFIVIDKPFVHYDVKATFELFCPNIGSIVKGKINRISQDYVGCLVHNTINVAVKLHDNAPEELSNFLAVDRMILLKITCFDYHRRVIRVKGEITDECIKLMKEIPSFNTPSNVFKNSRSTYYSSDLSDDEVDNKKTSDENEDNSNHSQSLFESHFSPQNEDPNVFNCDHLAGNTSGGEFHSLSSQDSDSTHASPKKKSSKKKDGKVESSSTVTESEAMEIDTSPDRKGKKKKKDKDKKSKSKPSKEDTVNHHSKSSGKKKKTKDKSLPNSILPDNKLVESPKKKGSSKKKKSKNQLLNSTDKTFDLSLIHDDLSNTSIKEEITTDSGYPSLTSSSKKIKKPKKSLQTELNLDENDVENMIETLSFFQPNPDDQLLMSTVKEEPEGGKKSKKRKHDSSHKDDRSSKKKKKTDGEKSSKDKKSSKKDKSKKKDKTSKKDKKKKLQGKSSKSKKDKLSFKINSEKSKKNKDKSAKRKKLKKSSKEKTEAPKP